MKEALKKFTTETLFDATADLLSTLHIQFDRETAEPIDIADFYDGVMPQYLRDALTNVSHTYFIGIVNDDSLRGVKRGDSLADVADTMERGGKYDGMFIFAIDVKPSANLTRTDASALTRAFNRMASANPVILVIRQGSLLSLATCERTTYSQEWRRGNGEKLGRVNILRNINCEDTHRGHLDILSALGEKTFATFDELYAHWLDTFSSELLTKKFYGELSDWYAWAVQVARFPNNLRTNEDDAKFNHESCIRLITRLIFVWFLKQKKLIPDEFFDEDYICEHFIDEFDPHNRKTLLYDAEKGKYYRLILQNLFFAMLNCPIVAEGKDTPNNRRFRKAVTGYHKNSDYNVNNLMRYEGDFKEGGAKKFVKLANTNVPFLNGGLFDCLDDKPRQLYYDGFSERQESLDQLYFPDYLFFGDEVGKGIDLSQWYGDKKKKSVSARGIIDILERYSFTIEENTPLDQEVSLDPELLGKVFENLLASFNPETKTSARKQTGSFYTPREIVQYMVDESLVAHLKRMCGEDDEQKYRDLVSYATDDVELTVEQRRSIMNALYNCRVLDPACGSGAFPMGVLQQMVHVLKRIDPTNEMWNDMMVNLAIEDAKRELRKAAGNEQERQRIEDNRKARLDDIENAFNQSINDPDYARKLYLIEHCIYGVDIQPIATQISKLRFFISLVVDQKPTTDAKNNFGIRPLPNLEAKFVTANTLIPLDRSRDLFTGSEDVRYYEELLHDINHRIFLAKRNKDKEELRQHMMATRAMMAQSLENLGVIGHDGFKQLSEWNMFDQNASASFFDPEWMFGVKDGFDVVIGNPPYVQLQANEGTLANLYQPYNYSTFDSGGDIYQLFYEGGLNQLCNKGHLCFITSNKWMRAGYGEKSRNYFVKNTHAKLLINFGGVKVFESASVDTNIILFQKKTSKKGTTLCYAFSDPKEPITDLHGYLHEKLMPVVFVENEMWTILTEYELSIKKKITSAGTPLSSWNVDINRGILTGYNKAFIIPTSVRDSILSQCLSEDERTRTQELIRPIVRGKDVKKELSWAGLWLINAHNGIRGHIDRINIEDYPAVKSFLDLHWDKISNRSDKGDTPYNLRNCAYFTDFAKPKIIYPETTQGAFFVYDKEGMYIDKTCFMLISDKAEYLQITLSSQLFEFAYKRIFSSIELGASGYQYNKHALLKLPIAIPSDESYKEVEDRDNYIYTLYGISDEEIDYIKHELNSR